MSAVTRAVSETIRTSWVVPDRVRLLNAGIEGGRITLDLSREILAYGTGAEMEAALREVLDAAGAAVGPGMADVEYRLLVEGQPLDRVLAQIDPLDPEARGVEARSLAQSGIRGQLVVISPGHGWYWNQTYRQWMLQRGETLGVQEDFVNAEIAMILHDQLLAAGADSRGARNLSKTAGNGESGSPRWQEGALYHAKTLGAPSWVWNSTAVTSDADVRTRPLFANWLGAAALVSVHNNASPATTPGEGTGTEIWIDTSNGQRSASERLARAIQQRLIGRLRTYYDRNWPDRGLQPCNGCLGENRLATRPSVLIELAFMDRASPDNAAIKSAFFRQQAALGIREGLEDFFGVASPVPTPTPAPTPAPTPPPPVSLWIDGRTASTRPQGQAFGLEARGLTSYSAVTRWMRQPNGAQTVLSPTLQATFAGGVYWTFTPVCTTPLGVYTLWVVDNATGRASNQVTETVTRGTGCP